MTENQKRWLDGLALIASGGVPWVDRILPGELIGAYYRPLVEILAMVLALLGFGWRWTAFRGKPALDPKKKWALWAFVMFVLCVFACLWFSMNLGDPFDPGPNWLKTVRFIWCAVYIGAAISLGVFLASLVQLIPVKKKDG